jgi:hypothetical protein
VATGAAARLKVGEEMHSASPIIAAFFFKSTCGYRAVDFQCATAMKRAKRRRSAGSQPQFGRDAVLNACELERGG